MAGPSSRSGHRRSPRLDITTRGHRRGGTAATWQLGAQGCHSLDRYVTRAERSLLEARQDSLGRQLATSAALIPIRKSAAWWNLPPDERRAIFEERSHHIQTGIEYLPAVARRLYRSREFGEPFDFLTWFEYGPDHAAAFEELVGRLRNSEEWRYVEREVDVRLMWDPAIPATTRIPH